MAKSKKRSAGSGGEAAKLVERDLTALAREGRLPVGHGLDAAVAEVLALLGREGKAPLLAGEPGVGKSAIVQELARHLVDGRRILEVPAAGIFARSSSPKQAAELLEELLEDLARVPGTIVYLRDVGLVQGSSLGPVLVRALRSEKLKFIFESDLRRAQALLLSDEALAERMHLLVVQEPTVERARWILGRVAEELEAELGLPIDPAACDVALRLSTKFLLARRLPRKALELLRETAAEAAGTQHEKVGVEDVLARFCSATRLPRFMVDDALSLDLAQTQAFFSERILGQEDAVSAVLRSVALLKAGLNDPRRPIGAFLFAGPTGVGKTHLAKLLAEYLFGSAERLVRLNMADYQAEGDETNVFGAPWAQNADGKRGELTRLLDGKVFAVLLLDEFEKAHAAVHDRFLQLFDEGRFINAGGETVPCNNVLIVATSNVGAEVYREPPIGFSGSRSDDDLRSEVDRRIGAAFRAEFLNRFDAICHFQPLRKVEIRRIAHREVGRVLERDGIRTRGLDVEVAPEVVDLLVDRGYSPVFGARFLQREIEKTLTAALAVEIVRTPLAPGTRVKVVALKGRVVAQAESPSRPRDATAQVSLPGGKANLSRRRLDRSELITEADRLLRRASEVTAAAGRSALEEQRRELLVTSQSPGFWDDAERAAQVLRTFRDVDAHVGELERLVEGCKTAQRRARDARTEPKLAAAGQALEEAAREVQLAEARVKSGAGAEADEALLDLCAAAEGEGAKGWLDELLHLYLGWAEKRRYEAKVVAEGKEPLRVVVQLTGPGVFGFLTGERGLHRRIEEQQRVSAFVRLHHPVSAAGKTSRVLEAREVRRHAGAFLERVTSEAKARDDASGRLLELSGNESPEALKAVAAAVLDGQAEAGPEARRYFMGRGARAEDPRTGAGTPRIKDVMRGEIDLFIAAWLARPPGEQPVGG
jgi:ATP-dependent Clp protease ATP-binding subunit ClpA/protein subunit release factor B